MTAGVGIATHTVTGRSVDRMASRLRSRHSTAALPPRGFGFCRVTLTGTGRNRIATVADLRAAGADFETAMDLARSLPAVLADRVDEDYANALAGLLRTHGATVEITRAG